MGVRLYDPLSPATDPVDAVWALAEERAAKGAEGNRDPEGWLPFAMRRLGPALRAAANGHEMAWDPPAALTSLSRWTCTRCGKAVLAREYEPEAAYGPALTEKCPKARVADNAQGRAAGGGGAARGASVHNGPAFTAGWWPYSVPPRVTAFDLAAGDGGKWAVQ